jgi:hypothetical protein
MKLCEGVDRILLTQDRDQWLSLVNGNESSGSIKGEEFLRSVCNHLLLSMSFVARRWTLEMHVCAYFRVCRIYVCMYYLMTLLESRLCRAGW